MLSQSADGGDPAGFRDTALFQKCLEMGLIPRSETELAGAWQPRPAAREPEPAGIGHRKRPPDTLGLRLKVSGMWCPVCAWAIEETLRKQPGVINPTCIFSNDTLLCDYHPVETSPATIIAMVERLGYPVHLPDERTRKKEGRAEFIRLSVSSFLTMNIMMLSFALYFGFFRPFSSTEISTLSWPVFAMASIVFFYGGARMHQHALRSLRTGVFGMETLISTGAVSAYGFSIYNLASGSLHLYFDTAAMLITLALIGKWLERGARDRVGKTLDALFSLQPTKVRICRPGDPTGRYVSARHLQPGDTFRVTAGEVIPADGRVVGGQGTVDESSITGEALPRKKAAGDGVMSGVRVARGDFQVRARRVGPNGTLGQMLSLIETTLAKKTPLETLADKHLRWFVPVIMILALATGIVGWAMGLSGDTALVRAVTVLVVSCPCALGVAIPLARVAGISIAGARGILVRSFAAFDQARSVDAVVLDKTGTVTHGQWALREIKPAQSFTATFLLGLAAGLEAATDHPVGAEIRRQAREKRVTPLPVSVIERFENGVGGRYDGKPVRIGSAEFLRDELAATRLETGRALSESGGGEPASRVYVGVAGRLAGVLVFGDRIRPHVAPTLRRLKASGVSVALVSGDGEDATRWVAQALGVTRAAGSQSPADKAAFVRRWQASGKTVAMVGDGVNDAPALAQADLAIALYSGHPLGQETADITLMSGDMRRILDFLPLAALVRAKIAQNLVFTFLYNIIAVPVAMAGWLSPLVAVSAMLLSSLSVIGNTLLMVRAASHESPADGRVDQPLVQRP